MIYKVKRTNFKGVFCESLKILFLKGQRTEIRDLQWKNWGIFLSSIIMVKVPTAGFICAKHNTVFHPPLLYSVQCIGSVQWRLRPRDFKEFIILIAGYCFTLTECAVCKCCGPTCRRRRGWLRSRGRGASRAWRWRGGCPAPGASSRWSWGRGSRARLSAWTGRWRLEAPGQIEHWYFFLQNCTKCFSTVPPPVTSVCEKAWIRIQIRTNLRIRIQIKCIWIPITVCSSI